MVHKTFYSVQIKQMIFFTIFLISETNKSEMWAYKKKDSNKMKCFKVLMTEKTHKKQRHLNPIFCSLKKVLVKIFNSAYVFSLLSFLVTCDVHLSWVRPWDSHYSLLPTPFWPADVMATARTIQFQKEAQKMLTVNKCTICFQFTFQNK